MNLPNPTRFVLPLMVLAMAASAANPPRPSIDKTRPVRMDQRFVVRHKEREVATILSSSFLVLDEKARAQTPQDFHRLLVRFADGARVAMYSSGDYRDENAYLIRTLVVDANKGEWVLLTIKGKKRGKGFGSAKATMEREDHEALVGFETRRLRLSREFEGALSKGRAGEIFQTAEPQLVELLQKVRRELPSRGDPSIARAIPEMFSHYLLLPEVPECDHVVERLQHLLANDEPEPAKPLDSEFEAEFGKWASWRELPRLKGN